MSLTFSGHEDKQKSLKGQMNPEACKRREFRS